MAAVDLVFDRPQLVNPAHLVFGETLAAGDYEVTLAANLPALSVNIRVAQITEVTFAGVLPGLTVSIAARYDSNVSRPTVGQVGQFFQGASKAQGDATFVYQHAKAAPAGVETSHNAASALRSSAKLVTQIAQRQHAQARTGQQDAVRAATQPVRAQSQHAVHIDARAASSQQNASPLRSRVWSDWQERHRDRRPMRRTGWQAARGVSISRSQSAQTAVPMSRVYSARFQQAMRPPAGREAAPVVPPLAPCYYPDLPAELIFGVAAGGSDLLFRCDLNDEPQATVTVPIKRVYMVINNVSLRRVSDNAQIAAHSITMSIDADSWTWGFGASLPGSMLDAVMPDNGSPVELEVNINGTLYRVLAEQISRDRAFGRNEVRVQGRGKSALLASPYSPVMTFSNSIARTAQQLMADVLTLNGQPIGWSIDWQIDDWLVPSGVFAVQGSYIEGLNAVANAVGAYLQPHPTLQELRVMPRYKDAPWSWGSVTPDFEIPASVAIVEGIEWIDKPAYNRVYVSGVSQGVLGRVTRTGSAGDLMAPMATDALITQAVAARQRGLAILGDTGRQANVSIRMPVLAETGVITPGKYVRYTDGATSHFGVVRGTSIDAPGNEVWQQLSVETHL